MFRALVFDLDGLMIDTEGLYWSASRKIASSLGKELSDDTLRKMMGRGPLDSMRVFSQDLGLDPRHRQSPEQLLALRTAMMIEAFQAGVEPMPGLMHILKTFHGRLKLAIGTSAPKKFTDLILPRLGVLPFFDFVQTSDGLTHHKPHPEIYQRTITRLNVLPAETVILEDSAAGARAGKAAGAHVIAVPSRYTVVQDFSLADQRARDLLEASNLVEALLSAPAA